MERAKNTPDSTVDHRAIARGVHLQGRERKKMDDQSSISSRRISAKRSRLILSHRGSDDVHMPRQNWTGYV